MSLNLAVDVQYRGDENAVAAGIAFADWTSERVTRTELVHIADVKPYSPGRFFERELPCLIALLDRFAELPATIVIDGFVTLGADARDGLGAHLFAELGGEVPVIGVAKTRFAGTPAETQVLRGSSKRPLYVTSIGIALEEAKALIRGMHGPNRVPTLLTAVDRACRTALGEHTRGGTAG